MSEDTSAVEESPLSQAASAAQEQISGLNSELATVNGRITEYRQAMANTTDPTIIEATTNKIEKLKNQKLKIQTQIIAKSMAVFPCFPPGLRMPLAAQKKPMWGGQGSFDPNSNNPDNSIRQQAENILSDTLDALLAAATAPLTQIIETFMSAYKYIVEAFFGLIPSWEEIISLLCEQARAQFDSFSPEIQNVVNSASAEAGGGGGLSYSDYYRDPPEMPTAPVPEGEEAVEGEEDLAETSTTGVNSNFRCYPNQLLAQLPCAILQTVLEPVGKALDTFWKPLFIAITAAATLAGKSVKFGGQAGEDAAAAAAGGITESVVAGAKDIAELPILELSDVKIVLDATSVTSYVKINRGWQNIYGYDPKILEGGSELIPNSGLFLQKPGSDNKLVLRMSEPGAIGGAAAENGEKQLYEWKDGTGEWWKEYTLEAPGEGGSGGAGSEGPVGGVGGDAKFTFAEITSYSNIKITTSGISGWPIKDVKGDVQAKIYIHDMSKHADWLKPDQLNKTLNKSLGDNLIGAQINLRNSGVLVNGNTVKVRITDVNGGRAMEYNAKYTGQTI